MLLKRLCTGAEHHALWNQVANVFVICVKSGMLKLYFVSSALPPELNFFYQHFYQETFHFLAQLAICQIKQNTKEMSDRRTS